MRETFEGDCGYLRLEIGKRLLVYTTRMTGQGKRVGVPPHSKKKNQSQSKENRKVR